VEPAVTEGLALAHHAEDGPTRARLLNLLGVTRIFTDPPATKEVLNEAIALSRHHEESITLVSSLAMQGFAEALCGDLDAAARSLEECLTRSAPLGASQPQVMGLVGLGHVRTHQGDTARAGQFLDDGLTMARELGNPIWFALALAFRAELDTSLADHVQARQLAAEAVDVARKTGSAPVIGLCLAVAGNVELAAREPAASVSLFTESLAHCASGERGGVRSRALVGLGRAKLVDEPVAAQELLEDALDFAEKSQNRLATGAALYWLGRCASRRDDHGGALGFHREALATQGQAGHHRAIPASVEAVAAELAHHGEVTKAAHLLGAADSLRAGTGSARSPEDQTNCQVVAILADETIGFHDRHAATIAGAELSPERLMTYACGGTGPRKRPHFGWPSLTPTELRVVDLVAEHLTNAQIGERLFMAPGTVKTHLAHVYRKLELRSRGDVAREALRRRSNPR
jgi:DNA-binding CsgD family transcriptional regulator/tetratricopeptide (TPR) repeat protein